jgi:acetyl-CoA synthetase
MLLSKKLMFSLFRGVAKECRPAAVSVGQKMRIMGNSYVEDICKQWHNTNGINLGYYFLGRHDPKSIALITDDRLNGDIQTYTFADIDNYSATYAAIFKSLGVQKGDRIAVMLPKGLCIVAAALAIWRLGAVYVPLFTAFGPDAIGVRTSDASVSLIITNYDNAAKFDAIATLGMVKVALFPSFGLEQCRPPRWSFVELPLTLNASTVNNAQVKRFFNSEAQNDDTCCNLHHKDPFILLYTSGTTGKPKGNTSSLLFT